MVGESSIASSILETLLEQRQNKVERGFYWENQIAFVYNSEKMEGNPLSKDQTRAIFETRTIRSDHPVPLDAVRETNNQFRLFDYMLDTVDEPLSSELIKEFHRILKSGTADDDNPDFAVGDYKTVPNGVGDIDTTPPSLVAAEMERLLSAYGNKHSPTLRDIAAFHVFFERIHPFQDGNGRVGRAVMFRECLAHGRAPFIVLDESRDRYYRGLASFSENPDELSGYFEDLQELYLEEFSNLIPEHLLLPDLEKYASKKAVAEEAESYFARTAGEGDKPKREGLCARIRRILSSEKPSDRGSARPRERSDRWQDR